MVVDPDRDGTDSGTFRNDEGLYRSLQKKIFKPSNIYSMKTIFFTLIILCSLSLSAQDVAMVDVADNESLTSVSPEPTPVVHCEVPCGIYGDSLRISLISEHISTIEKGMNQIMELSGETKPNYNQLIRWVSNKEAHAEEIQHIVSQYFMHQRIKLTDMADKEKHAKYVKQLTHLHEMSVYAMKCKQSTDLKNIEALRKAVKDFEGVYFHKHDHNHKH